jgi:3'-phosphoadenosine 5'-phosphosulfate sulfotransferase (PAPS reductase)/FAD synthetase
MYSSPIHLAEQAMAAIGSVMEAEHPIVCAFSAGKDSSCLVNLVLDTAVRRKAAGRHTGTILITHSDTGVESPEVRALADTELQKIARFGEEAGLDVRVKIGRPHLYASWPVRVIGGRALPSFPNTRGDCSVSWKVEVGERLQKAAFKELRGRGGAGPVLMTGVRIEESTARAANIASRGELANAVWSDPDGRLRLSPLLNWGSDDVWEYLGYASAGVIRSYSDFQDTMRFYRDAGGSSCAVVGDMRLGEVAKQSGGCGARSGCWACVRVSKDQSLVQMIKGDPERYGYMTGLNRLRDFIANTQYDWSRRTFLGRTIDEEGFVQVQADVYSPSMLEELLRYALTLQAVEQVAARELGIEPRFHIIGYKELIAIDALWSLYGLHEPFHALHIFEEVRAGAFSFPPELPPAPPSPVPRYGKLWVGPGWNEDLASENPERESLRLQGIRSLGEELTFESCGTPVRETARGDLVTDWPTSDGFDIDEEGAADFVEMMARDYIARYHRPAVDRTIALHTYFGMGFLTPSKTSLQRWHDIARRTQWMQRHGVLPGSSLKELLALQAARSTFPAAPLPQESLWQQDMLEPDLEVEPYEPERMRA